ncbi:ribosomal RNA small subunit methyltransferase G [Firmicutes bacterium CAG:534]|nr:ribosomal RNA small subunit methyltransferase G [Firmicutes bacterium CAG:534]
MEKQLEIFEKDLKQLHLELSKKQILQFISYYELLIDWNSRMNLTAITEFEDVLKKHFIDSLSLISAVSDLAQKQYDLIDVGTGAGFPGIPLKIAFPNLKITLLDSLNKRIQFLNEVICKLELQDIEAVHGRAEDFAKPDQFRERFDLCVSRAVANLATLSEYCIPFVKPGGFFISYKSEKVNVELEEAKKAISVLGGSFQKNIEFLLPHSDITRNFIVIQKKNKTPLKYPRKAGLPSKEPIY